MNLMHRHRTRNITIGSFIAAVGTGAAAYGIYKLIENRKDGDSEHQQEDRQHDENEKIIQTASDVLVNKIGARESEVEEARLMSKTAFDVAHDKGFSDEQLKMFINQERTRPIDEFVLNRKIADEVGEQVKQKIREHTENWDGRFI